MTRIAIAVMVVPIAVRVAIMGAEIGSISTVAVGIGIAIVVVTASHRGTREGQLGAGNEARHRQRGDASPEGLLPCHPSNIGRQGPRRIVWQSQPGERARQNVPTSEQEKGRPGMPGAALFSECLLEPYRPLALRKSSACGLPLVLDQPLPRPVGSAVPNNAFRVLVKAENAADCG